MFRASLIHFLCLPCYICCFFVFLCFVASLRPLCPFCFFCFAFFVFVVFSCSSLFFFFAAFIVDFVASFVCFSFCSRCLTLRKTILYHHHTAGTTKFLCHSSANLYRTFQNFSTCQKTLEFSLGLGPAKPWVCHRFSLGVP